MLVSGLYVHSLYARWIWPKILARTQIQRGSGCGYSRLQTEVTATVPLTTKIETNILFDWPLSLHKQEQIPNYFKELGALPIQKVNEDPSDSENLHPYLESAFGIRIWNADSGCGSRRPKSCGSMRMRMRIRNTAAQCNKFPSCVHTKSS
jgi:hypothetical protein